MILTSFDPGKVASYAVFDTSRPWEIEVGEVRQIGVGRELRPCGIHIRGLVSASDQALVEKVGAMPGQGVTSMLTFGMCYGAIMGAISALEVPLERVSPQDWKSGSRIGALKDDAAKNAARAYAKELWPQHAALFDVKKNHGMAEAGLMARWYFLKGPGRDIAMDEACPVRRSA